MGSNPAFPLLSKSTKEKYLRWSPEAADKTSLSDDWPDNNHEHFKYR